MKAEQLPVLVVGGRVSGLMMASELKRHGVAVRIIDQSPGIDPHSRATYLRARTLEILQGLDLASEIVAKGQPHKATSYYSNGKHLGTIPELPVDSPFSYGAAFAQCKTENILQKHLNSLGVEVERSTELVSFRQSADGVQAIIKKPDGSEEKVNTPWLIGCDGAHSTIRKHIDKAFPGETDRLTYLLADVIVDGPIKPEVAYLYLHSKGDVFIFLLDEGRRQVIATLKENSQRSENPSLEEMQQLLDERGSSDLRLSDPRWLSLYHTNYRLAPHYRNGRVFLVGDAAHVTSFIGGQGMNTAIQDAHNLAWKLALVMYGIAPDWWLDTYEEERRGIAEDVLAWTKKATEELTLFPELGPEERKRLLEMATPELELQKQREHTEELDLDYRSSRLCCELDQNISTGPHPGSRAPDASPLLIGGKTSSLIEVLRSPNHHLLLFSLSKTEIFEPELITAIQKTLDVYRNWLEVLVVGSNKGHSLLPAGSTLLEDPEGVLRKSYAGDDARLYLIRPDGYVAYRSRRIDSLDDYMLRVIN